MDNINSKTIEYYNENARAYAEDTLNADMTAMRSLFMKYVPAGRILDLGCGSGRDSKFFKSAGYEVDAIDGSEELCKIASETAGICVRCMTFDELEDIEKYDGIWACASLLHVEKSKLTDVFRRIERALSAGGYLYASFKLSEFEGYRNGRYFTDFTEDIFSKFLDNFPHLHLIETCITGDVRPDRENEKWLNVIIEKYSQSQGLL